MADLDDREGEAEWAAREKPLEVLETLRDVDAQWRARLWKKDGGCGLVRGAVGAKVGNELRALAGGGGGQEEGAWRAGQQALQATSRALEEQEKLEAQGRAQQCGKDGE